MMGKKGQEDGTAAFPVEILPLGGQMFTEFWAKKRIWRKENKFDNSNSHSESKFQFLLFKTCRELKCM